MTHAIISVKLSESFHKHEKKFTFYAANPSGWLWELGWGARESLTSQEHYTRDIFGHGNEAKGYGMDIEL